MALVVTRAPFELNGRYYAVGTTLSPEDAALVKADRSKLRLCVDQPSILDGAPTPNIPAPVTVAPSEES